MGQPNERMVVSTRQVVCCVTCALLKGKAATTEELAVQAIWDSSWDLCAPDEEMEAFDHAKANPQHIIVRAVDFGAAVNGV